MKTYTVNTKEMLEEHKEIVPKLRKVGLITEANDQSKELKEIKKKVLRKTVKKHIGKGGLMADSSYGQAATPINLLKTGPTPPTVSDRI